MLIAIHNKVFKQHGRTGILYEIKANICKIRSRNYHILLSAVSHITAVCSESNIMWEVWKQGAKDQNSSWFTQCGKELIIWFVIK